jgi:hypothetical protein
MYGQLTQRAVLHIWPYTLDTNVPYRDTKRHYDYATGRAAQIEPMNPILKAPKSKRLKLEKSSTAFELCFHIQIAALHTGPKIIGVLTGGSHYTSPRFWAGSSQTRSPYTCSPHTCF